jgi:hypothetical protein
MFKNKGVNPTKKQVVVDSKVSNPLVHMVDVNMAITRNKVIEEHVGLGLESQSRRNLLLTGKRNKDYNNLLLRLYRRCK